MLHSHSSKMYKQCRKSNENSIEFSLSTLTWSRLKLLWLESYTCSHGIPNILVLPRLHTSILILFIQFLQNTLTFIQYIIFSLLFLVLSMFLTMSSLSSSCNLKLCFSAVFLPMNIPVALLSSNALTITPPCVSIFSIPILSHTSLSILNVLLTSLWLTTSITISFRVFTHVLLCCTFLSMKHTTTPHSFFFPILYSGHLISYFSCFNTFPLIVSLFLHFIYYTLVTSSLFISSSLQFYASWQELHHIFFTCLLKRNPCSQFSQVQTLLLSYPPQSIYIVITSSITHPLSSRSMPFPMWNILVSFLTVPFMV